MFKAIESGSGREIVILAEEWAGRLAELRRMDAAHALVCQGCRQPVRVKAGQVYRWHFAHKHLANCTFGQEPAVVLECRALLYRRLAREFGEAVTLERRIEDAGLPRPVDCWVETEAGRFAYWIVDRRMAPESRGSLQDALARAGAQPIWVFAAEMLQRDAEHPSIVHLSTTERDLMRETYFDGAIEGGRFVSGCTLHYLDPKTETLTTFRRLHLFHEPAAHRGWVRTTPLAEVLVSRKTGDLAHPGEPERARQVHQERRRLEEAERERRAREEQERREREARKREEQARLEKLRREQEERDGSERERLPEQGRQERERRERERREDKEREEQEQQQRRLQESLEAGARRQPRERRPREEPGPAPSGTQLLRAGTCVFCGQVTTDWWTYDGTTGTCKCHSCRQHGRV